jgi:hypothetical protein
MVGENCVRFRTGKTTDFGHDLDMVENCKKWKFDKIGI